MLPVPALTLALHLCQPCRVHADGLRRPQLHLLLLVEVVMVVVVLGPVQTRTGR